MEKFNCGCTKICRNDLGNCNFPSLSKITTKRVSEISRDEMQYSGTPMYIALVNGGGFIARFALEALLRVSAQYLPALHHVFRLIRFHDVCRVSAKRA